MKRILFVLILGFVFLKVQATQVIFSGHIKNAPSDEVRVSLLLNELTQERSVFVCRLNAENKFSISIDVPKNQITHLIYNETVYELFVDLTLPEIKFEVDANDWEKSILFQGKGGANNQFFSTFRYYYAPQIKEIESYNLGFLSTFYEKEQANLAKAYAIHDYFKKLEENYNRQTRYLDNSPRISRAMRDFARNEISWIYETNKLGYFLFNKDFIEPSKLRDYWLRYRLMQTVDISDEKSLQFLSYQNLLSAFIHYLHLESLQGKEQGLDLDFYRFIERNLSGRPRFFMQGKLMLNAYQNGYPDLAQRKFKAYLKYNPYPEYTRTLEYIFGNNLDHVKKETVPDFKFQHIDGSTKHLSDYRGKVVFVSLWASWCSPCIKSFRETAQSRQELGRMGVVFLNVNIDEQEHLWHQSISRLNTNGEHVFALNMTDFQKKMGFTTIPFYALIDKYGRLNYLTTEDINTSKDDFLALLKQ